MTVGRRREAVPAFGWRSLRVDSEQGSTLPLILVFFLVAAGLIVVVGAATALHLERLRLLTVADGAALAGAESFGLDDVQVDDARVTPALRADAVQRAVDAYLADAPTAQFAGFRVDAATTTDGHSATVQLSATWRPPIAGDLVPLSLPITVRSDARAEFR
ncbi:pilus assembly protein TadG-related protein [uncultured Amnibacterium sp.]|uniref:pilus assembly protein TadG-related protein n=1 Tax=uncultured Amnibacterium sp. TaxID=1631851 RepID=UPI0035CB5608